MELLEALLLGIIQGITEFLPISSSGHLVLAKEILGFNASSGITFEIVVHFGTFCSIVAVFYKKIAQLLTTAFKTLKNPGKFFKNDKGSDEAMIAGILISMVPVFIVGVFFKDYVETLFENPLLVSSMLIVTGIILFFTRFGKETEKSVSKKNAFIIGLAQAFAVIPGISRAGSTIATGMYLGVKREEIANFSFIMVLPVFAGAMLLQILDFLKDGTAAESLYVLLVGFLSSFLAGYFTLNFLINLLKSKGIYPFAIYCWIVGGIGVLFFLMK